MKNPFILFGCLLSFFLGLFNEVLATKQVEYPLTDDPIDVVIVTHPKDKDTLELCIQGIRQTCDQVGRVIVVSSEKISENAEWFDERKFPFSITDIVVEIGRGDRRRGERYFENLNRGPGWYFQQLVKLYAAFVIPDISPNVLVLDSDTVFLNPIRFTNEVNGGLFCISPREAKPLYLEHAKRLVPGYVRVNPENYSVCHHMLFQKPILKHLFKTVENYHKRSFWRAFCRCVDLTATLKGASEYEIYSNFALRHTDQVEWRQLLWANSPDIGMMEDFRAKGYHFASFHTYLRKNRLPRPELPWKKVR